MARTLCSSGGPLLVLKLVIASQGGHFLPLVQLDRDNYAINGTGSDFPSIYRECALLRFNLVIASSRSNLIRLVPLVRKNLAINEKYR
ncbi:hypothetical protein VI01_15195 [Pantoea sp. SM3]|nr:hypothetical protein VI01_15195 [Pantoea sp. SM3]